MSSSGSRSRNLLVEQEKGTPRRSRRSIGGASEEKYTDSEKENDATVGKDNELKTVLSVKKASRLSLSSSKSRCRNPLGEIRGFGNGTCLDRRREETNDAVKLMESKLKTTCAVETADLPGDGDWAGGHCPNDNVEIADLRSQVSKSEMLFVVANATNLRLEREVADLAEVLRAEKEARVKMIINNENMHFYQGKSKTLSLVQKHDNSLFHLLRRETLKIISFGMISTVFET